MREGESSGSTKKKKVEQAQKKERKKESAAAPPWISFQPTFHRHPGRLAFSGETWKVGSGKPQCARIHRRNIPHKPKFLRSIRAQVLCEDIRGPKRGRPGRHPYPSARRGAGRLGMHRSGIRHFVIMSSGFKETGDEAGKQREERLSNIAMQDGRENSWTKLSRSL